MELIITNVSYPNNVVDCEFGSWVVLFHGFWRLAVRYQLGYEYLHLRVFEGGIQGLSPAF